MNGSIVSHYQIEEEIGRGGMGVVYRAQDIRLNRTVALKFLPSFVAENEAATERFTREAQTAAKTEHTNVCGVYDIGESEDGRAFIAMPFYEGDDLADRVKEQRLPVIEAVAIARQAASGLASVHVHGIIHRDIKPGNIFLTNDGVVKILDFGLARIAGQQSVTEAGSAVGTFAYMSPEQVRGERLDPRTDIWSLGATLYELLTGKRPFRGDYVEAQIYSVLNEEPAALSETRSDLPDGLETIVHRCLERDRSLRYQSMAEVENDLAAIESGLLPDIPVRRQRADSDRRVMWGAVAAVSVVVALGIVGVLALRHDQGESSLPVRYAMLLPDGHEISTPGPSLAISRDGARLAFASSDSDGTRIFIRDIDAFDARAVEGTEDGRTPFFSPDGDWLGFIARDRMYKVPVDGGRPQELTKVSPLGSFMTGAPVWTADNRILFSSDPTNASLSYVSAQGGPVERLTSVEREVIDLHVWPEVLPSGEFVLYTKVSQTSGPSIVALSLKDASKRTLIENATRPSFLAPDILVYAVGSDLFAVRFDEERAEILGSSVPVLNSVMAAEIGFVEYDVSETGTVVYATQGAERFQTQPSIISRSGGLNPLSIEMLDLYTPRSSPDGRYVAFQRRAPDQLSLWIHDLERGVTRQLTDDASEEWWYTWTPDSRNVIFNSTRDTTDYTVDLFVVPVDGSEEPRMLSDGTGHQMPHAVTPDGTTLIYNEAEEDGKLHLFARSLEGDFAPEKLVSSDAEDFHPAISPDGNWLAFASDRSSEWEVYVQPFSRPGAVMQVSSGGGGEPVWSSDGRTLFYRTPDGREFMAVDVSQPRIITDEPTLDLGAPRFVMEGPFFQCSKYGRSYDLAPNGQQFVVLAVDWPGAERRKFKVVLNWTTEVNEKLASTG